MIRKFFKDSETIAWARLQALVGTVLVVILQTDPHLVAPVIPTKWFPWYLLASGIITEVLRRLREEDM